MSVLLDVRDVTMHFGGVHALSDVSFQVRKGEFLCLIGPNGAGKTTALNQLSGELAPDSGEIDFDGRRITRLPIHRISVF